MSPYEAIVNRTMLLWGTFPILVNRFEGTDTLVEVAERILESSGLVQSRQVVGIVAGTATTSGATNFMRLHSIAER